MESLRGYLLMLTLLAVKAYEGPEMAVQREILPIELLDMLKQGSLASHPIVRQQGPRIKPYSMDPSIPFPLACPTMDNILAICQYSNLRPRYTKDMLPKSGFDHLRRQARAVNQLESWFTLCCSNGTQDEELTLCCAKQAWKKSLSTFCEEEFQIKTSHYHCCKRHGPEIWDCFEEEAPDLLYQTKIAGHEVATTLSSTIQGFDFNPSNCQKTSVSEIAPRLEMVPEPPPHGGMEQRLVIPGGIGFPHHVSSPRSRRPSILFPLARPNATNIFAICQYSNQRPRHPKETLPRSGSGYLHRQANAVNQLESWYTVCCANGTQDYDLTLCCAQQAWEKSLSAFCEMEFRVKTTHYHCCRERGLARLDCFEEHAPDKSYQPSGHEVLTMLPVIIQGFDFDPNSCQKTSISGVVYRSLTERTIKTEHISFPPGRPNSSNIEPICAWHMYRPRYLTNCLPRTGFDWLAHQVKAINGLEKSFRQCCKKNKDVHTCAEGKWKKMVDEFCKDERKLQVNQFECCKKQRGEEQYTCFSTAAPNPDYMIRQMQVPVEEGPHLDMFCNVYTALKKMKHLPFNVDEMAEKCCILDAKEGVKCLQIQLKNLSDDACKADDPSLAQVKPKCCKKTAVVRSKCLTKLLLNNIAKAKRAGKKICPIYS
ncbi:extracellular matrix protein 1 isoform X1 [Ictalurus furcatus]|uniref:extracellular matrix protein 1 isoform X1 n=1 Tax=Ictalurus furcatus TaxID=66913 RepID=UPI002350D288|nr:extracellular matrix protein 1 isoform X1 [Ictalurus furcatus]